MRATAVGRWAVLTGALLGPALVAEASSWGPGVGAPPDPTQPGSFLNLFAAFGLATAAGLNAWVPMLLLSLAAWFDVVHLAPPYDVLAHPGVVVGLSALVIVEGLADKVHGLDHLSHLIHAVLQPAAGAILFASQTGTITWVSPPLALLVGAILAGSVHSARAAVRVPVNLGAPVAGAIGLSVMEDVSALTLASLSLTAPLLAVAMVAIPVGILVLLAWSWYRRRRSNVATERIAGEGGVEVGDECEEDTRLLQ